MKKINVAFAEAFLRASEEVYNDSLVQSFVRARLRITPREAGYCLQGSPQGESCGNCRYQITTRGLEHLGGSCLTVIGYIDRDRGWCENYRRERKQRRSWLRLPWQS
jgi:hypothetical protein